MSGKLVAIVQARQGSSRLPGKVLKEINGQPMLLRVIRRAQRISGVQEVLVATTESAVDYPIIEMAKAAGAACFAGSETDVLDRYYRAALQSRADAIVRVTSDCPLLDTSVSSSVVETFLDGEFDYVSNTHPPTFPDGLDTEVFTIAALARAWSEARLPSEREHVTPYIWKHRDIFRTKNVSQSQDHSGLRWTVDEPADLDLVVKIYERLLPERGEFFGMEDVLGLIQSNPELFQGNAGIVRNAGYGVSLQRDLEKGRIP